MNEQTIILGAGITLFLYIWKSKKEIEYKKDEHWQLVQIKANNTANYSNYFLIILFAIWETVSVFSDIQTLNRVLTYDVLFIILLFFQLF